MKSDASVSQMGLDIHWKFSTVTARDGRGKIVWRQRLQHGDRVRMREELAHWPDLVARACVPPGGARGHVRLGLDE